MATAIVPAAGTGERLSSGSPKALVPLAGKPLAAWAVGALARAESVQRIVIAAPPGLEQQIGAVARDAARGIPIDVVAGGPNRSHSVANAVRAVSEGELVVIHDAARPLVTPELIDTCVSKLEEWLCAGIVAATPATDTIKQAGRDGRVNATLDRGRLWLVQTPQVFRAEVLVGALSRAPLDGAYDDAQLVEAAGGDVRIVEGPRENLKVTTQFDLRVAELLLAREPS